VDSACTIVRLSRPSQPGGDHAHMDTLASMEAKPHPDTQSHDTRSPITRTPAETPLVDVMGGASRHEIRITQGGGHGFIALLDAMPRLVPQGQTADFAIVQAARVSYGQGTKKVNEDRGLIRYLLRRHTTPFEMLEFKFHIAMPVFVARQWIRHRTANVNEYSGRYSIMPDQFYRPTVDEVRKQSAANRQGGEERFTESEDLRTAEEFVKYLEESEALYEKYTRLTEQGVSRELARIGLPVSIYTQWYWKCDLHNILRFLSLRMDSHAQAEIRWFAEAMYTLLEPIVPITMEAWRDYELESVRLTRLEVEALRAGHIQLDTENKREQTEWESKRTRLGL
jgi:thymidylate synthase (FAD)